MSGDDQVKKALSMGFAFPCACCKKLWWGFERGLDRCKAAVEGQDCGGPVVDQAFPLYEGPLTRHSIANMCFRCGKNADEAFVTPTGWVGTCKYHSPGPGRLVELRKQRTG